MRAYYKFKDGTIKREVLNEVPSAIFIDNKRFVLKARGDTDCIYEEVDNGSDGRNVSRLAVKEVYSRDQNRRRA